MRNIATIGIFALTFLFVPTVTRAEQVEAFGGAIKLETPKTWKSVQPRSRIVEKEYALSKEGVEADGRLTMMAASGSIEANIDRWIGQFVAADGGSVKKNAKVEKMNVGDNEIHFVELEGTFKESMGGGPFAPGKVVMRDDYQMLGAIIVNDGRQFFIKLTGPKEIVSENKEAFKSMLKGVK
ncbi:MAG: hypothetical protein R3C05_15525 [Pirellulaceae bacterium]